MGRASDRFGRIVVIIRRIGPRGGSARPGGLSQASRSVYSPINYWPVTSPSRCKVHPAAQSRRACRHVILSGFVLGRHSLGTKRLYDNGTKMGHVSHGITQKMGILAVTVSAAHIVPSRSKSAHSQASGRSDHGRFRAEFRPRFGRSREFQGSGDGSRRMLWHDRPGRRRAVFAGICVTEERGDAGERPRRRPGTVSRAGCSRRVRGGGPDGSSPRAAIQTRQGPRHARRGDRSRVRVLTCQGLGGGDYADMRIAWACASGPGGSADAVACQPSGNGWRSSAW